MDKNKDQKEKDYSIDPELLKEIETTEVDTGDHPDPKKEEK